MQEELLTNKDLTLIKKMWLLRGQIDEAIRTKNKNDLHDAYDYICKLTRRFEHLNTKSTISFDLLSETDELISQNASQKHNMKILCTNVYEIIMKHIYKDKIDTNIKEMNCLLHYVWVARGMFDKYLVAAQKLNTNREENFQLINDLLKNVTKLYCDEIERDKNKLSTMERLELKNIIFELVEAREQEYPNCGYEDIIFD